MLTYLVVDPRDGRVRNPVEAAGPDAVMKLLRSSIKCDTAHLPFVGIQQYE